MPRPKSCDHARLTAARAKYGLDGDVIHSASNIRRLRPLSSLATRPRRYRARMTSLLLGSVTSPVSRSRTKETGIARPLSGETRAKNAAYPQKSRFVHLSKG